MPSPHPPPRDETGQKLGFSDRNRYTNDHGASCGGFQRRLTGRRLPLCRLNSKSLLTAGTQIMGGRLPSAERSRCTFALGGLTPSNRRRRGSQLLTGQGARHISSDIRHLYFFRALGVNRLGRAASTPRLCRNGFSCDDPEVARRVSLVRASNDLGPQTSIFDKKLTSLRPPRQWHAICLSPCAQSQVNQFVSTEAIL